MIFRKKEKLSNLLFEVQIFARERKALFSVLVLLVLAGGTLGVMNLRSWAAFDNTINYQGRLMDGGVAASGPYAMVFKICDAVDGSNNCTSYVWTSTSTSVTVNNGLFSVILGNTVVGTVNGIGPVIPESVFNTDADRWLEVTVAGTTLSPAKKLAVSPRSFFARTAGLLGTKAQSDFIYNQTGTDQTARFQITEATGTIGMITNTGAGLSFRVDDVLTDSTPFVIDANGNVGIGIAAPAYKLDISTALANDRGINILNNATTGTNYGFYASVIGSGATTNTGGYFAVTGATSTGIYVFDLSGSATNIGIKVGNTTGTGVGTGVDIGTFANTGATQYGVTMGTFSGTHAAGGGTTAALNIGNISSAGATSSNYGILLGTMTGGTTANYQISTGAITSATTTTNAQINLGGLVTTGGTTNYGINLGALSGTGTTNYGINIANSTATGTNNYGMKIGTISGAASGTNYGLYVDTVSNATTGNYAAIFAGGNVGIGTPSPSAKLSITTTGTELPGTAASTTIRTMAGTLGGTAGNELALASFGYYNASGVGHESSLGIRAYRVSVGTGWTTAAIGLGLDVLDSVRMSGAIWFLANSGNVGIGTPGPTRTLDVASVVVHDASNGTTSQISVRGTADTTHKLNIGYDTTSNYGFIESVNQSVGWQNLALQPSGGNVGIGTATPTWNELLALKNNSNNEVLGLYIPTGITYTKSMIKLQTETSPSTSWKLIEGLSAGGGKTFVVYGNGGAYFVGSVGIGTTTLPANNRLSVTGDITNPSGGVCPFGYDFYDEDVDTVIDVGECRRTSISAKSNGDVYFGPDNFSYNGTSGGITSIRIPANYATPASSSDGCSVSTEIGKMFIYYSGGAANNLYICTDDGTGTIRWHKTNISTWPLGP